MTCEPTSILTLDDGTLALVVHGNATLTGTYGQADTGTGSGVIEYADGSAKRWVRFQARAWVWTMAGPAPSGLWDLDLSVDTWAATFPDPDNIGATMNINVVPARPDGAVKDINSANRSWSLTLREALAR